MTREVWILPVGLEYDRVLESLRRGGSEFHIIYSETTDGVSSAAQRYAEKVREYLESGPFKVKGYHGVDVLDLSACIRLLKSIVQKELDEGDEPVFKVNVGTSSKIVTMASLYVAAQSPDLFTLWYPKTKEYLIMELVERANQLAEARERGQDTTELVDSLTQFVRKYQQSGWTVRPSKGYEMISVPVIPLQELTSTQQLIVRTLAAEPYESASALAQSIFAKGGTGAEGIDGAKSTVSFALQRLIAWDLVHQRAVGKRKELSLSSAGRLYFEVFLNSPQSSRNRGRTQPDETASTD